MLKLVVLCSLVAAATCSLIAPIAPIAPLALSAPLLAPYNNNYRGPLSLAPGQPANIIAADGRPLDTLDVNLDRSAHLTAKALEGVRPLYLRKKRSALLAPWTVGTPLITRAAPIAPITPITHLGLSAPLMAANNYRGPLSLAPGQPANILAADGRPLDTLAVNLDRSAHITAKALAGARSIHLLKKRSAPLIAPLIANAPVRPFTYSSSILAPQYAATRITYTTPVLF